MRKPSRKVFFLVGRCLLLAHEEAKSEGVVVGCHDVSDLSLMMSSQKAFYSASVMPPTRP